MQISIKLEDTDWNYVLNVLQKRPMDEVYKLVMEMTKQAQEQTAAEAETTTKKKDK